MSTFDSFLSPRLKMCLLTTWESGSGCLTEVDWTLNGQSMCRPGDFFSLTCYFDLEDHKNSQSVSTCHFHILMTFNMKTQRI